MKNPNDSVAASEALPRGDCSTPPSAFLAAGFPNLSIFGETWHEMAAQVYLHALVLRGDTWQDLTPDEVSEAMKGLKPGEHYVGMPSVLRDKERMQRVSAKLRSADDARDFCGRWRCVSNERTEP